MGLSWYSLAKFTDLLVITYGIISSHWRRLSNIYRSETFLNKFEEKPIVQSIAHSLAKDILMAIEFTKEVTGREGNQY